MLTKKQQLQHNKKPKRKRCKNKDCNKLFTPQREMQPCCSYSCEMNYALKNVDKLVEDGKKLRAKEKRQWKQSDKSKLKEDAQKWFNKFIRLRDKVLPCISCGHTQGRQFHAGHYKPVGANQQLRFNELNCHKQCSICNNYKSGNLAEYRINLIKKIGLENVEALEKDKSTKKYSDVDLRQIISTYKEKCKEIEDYLN